ncbi:hypothetical protein EUTSA_v10020517mg [Eutrema salsugineum]|uniref:DUF1421 domain-containing protein n=1 Tax=Eutrema salsugineum TaxID=72664 RepID=V4M4Y1_EUTSA|nr:vacuolar protein sorting-associated protein 27 [Eutrema salsugineum]ESQ49977.1 hypothetical protein EUTSA_v10020517mg [Eutrema salsugineum]
MNTGQFMDKQIMDLSSSSPPSSDFIDLNNNNTTNSHDDDHQKQRVGDNGLDSNKEEIVPSYDFHPIRPNTTVGLSHSALDLAGSTTYTASRVLSASDSKPVSILSNRGFGSLDSIEPANLVHEKGQNLSDTTILSDIDRTMKKHVDTLLHVMEGVSARLTQLETRTHNLENLVDDLKVSVENSHGSTDGKMRQLENILAEVQSGVKLVKEKHEIFEDQLQLSKLQVSKVDQHPKTHPVHVDPIAQPPTPVTLQQIPQRPLTSFSQPPSSPEQILQPPSSHQSHQPSSSQLLAQLPTQFSPQQEPYSPPPSHSQPPPPNQLLYQAPPQTQPPQQLPYQSLPQQAQYPQQPPPPSSGYIPEEHPSHAMQSYSPNPPRQHPPAGSAHSQQFYNAHQHQPSMYDGAGGRSSSRESYPYTGSAMASAKPPHMSSSGTGYPQLSNARPLPHALPMAAAVNSGSSSSGSESRVPVDDVIDRVTTMGFPRDQVRATVRKLTEDGQAVDLNVVLDKLMNNGGASFGGR